MVKGWENVHSNTHNPDTRAKDKKQEKSYVQERAALILRELKEKSAVDPLKRAHVDKYYGVRRKASEALIEIGEPAVAPLIKALKNANPITREWVIRTLGEIKNRKAIKPLIKTLRKDEKSWIRERAAEALAKIGDKKTVKPLIQALKDEDRGVRGKAAEALGNIGNPTAVEPLIKALEEDRDDSGHVQACIAKALGKIRDPRAVDPLIKQLNEHNTLWWKIKWAEIQEWSKTKRTREKIALPMRQHLETGIRRGVQIRAIQALGEIRDPKAIEPLIKKLGDPLHEIWQATVEALIKMGEPAVEPLIQALKDEKWDVRAGAARSLGGIGDNKAVEPLIQALKDRNLTVRIHATEALVKIGEPAVESLTRTLINEKMTTDSLKYVKDALEKIRSTNKNKPAKKH